MAACAWRRAEEGLRAAYVISGVGILDDQRIANYRVLTQDSIAKYGRRYIVRGGAISIVKGEWHPKAIVIVEFPNMEQARQSHTSPEYTEAL
jgi:uncharacterized protein (DUF1330 family)